MATNSLATLDLYTTLGSAPPYAEMTRQGNVWNYISAAFTPLTVIPTTTANSSVWNNTSSAMSMVILDLFVFHLLGTAAQHNIGVWACVSPPAAAPSLSALVVGSQSGRAPYTTTAGTRVVTVAQGTVVANGWRPYGTPGPGVVSTALPGEAFSVEVNGKMVVPPGCTLSLACTDALATAASVQVGASWVELPTATFVPVA
jgi:hypothetical protein